jgi:hypothetical protein
MLLGMSSLPVARSQPLMVKSAATQRLEATRPEGTFHKVKKYLHLYVAEFQFRYNNRFNDDIFGTAIEGC